MSLLAVSRLLHSGVGQLGRQASTIARPQLRGFGGENAKRAVILSVGISLSCCAFYVFAIALPYRRAYDEFLKNYDTDAEFERMRKLGVFHSCPPDEE